MGPNIASKGYSADLMFVFQRLLSVNYPFSISFMVKRAILLIFLPLIFKIFFAILMQHSQTRKSFDADFSKFQMLFPVINTLGVFFSQLTQQLFICKFFQLRKFLQILIYVSVMMATKIIMESFYMLPTAESLIRTLFFVKTVAARLRSLRTDSPYRKEQSRTLQRQK